METDGRKREKGEFGGTTVTTTVAIFFSFEERKVVHPKYARVPFYTCLAAAHGNPRALPSRNPKQTPRTRQKRYIYSFRCAPIKKERVDVDVCQLQIQSVNVMMPAHVRVYACEGRTHTLRAGNPNSVYKTYSREEGRKWYLYEPNLFAPKIFLLLLYTFEII